jgi:Holliday junction resolvase
MGRSQREKGKRGERELAEVLRTMGFPARRGQQFRGGPDSPDVVGVPGLHIECKRAETFSLYAALAQADAEKGDGEIPVVMHRRNGERWVVCIYLTDLSLAAQKWVAAPRAEITLAEVG